MKRFIFLSICALFAVFVSEMQAGSKKDTTIYVNGNCNSCKKTIESALKNIDGIDKARWDKSTKILALSYDEALISMADIEKKIAEKGYDTEHVKATEESYNALHSCCKYSRKP